MIWSIRFSVVICIFALILPSAVLAARPADRGTGYAGGGAISDEGILYGDLYVLLRDGNGEPILDYQGCSQPVYVNSDGICEVIEMFFDPETNSCELLEDDVELVVGVETGRLSVSRTTDSVLDSAYTEALKNIENADSIDLDPAFRLRLKYVDYDADGDEIEETARFKTIDSPLEILAMYKKLLLNGRFPAIETNPLGDGEPVTYDPCSNNLVFAQNFSHLCDTRADIEDLKLSASFVAAGSDKGGQITLDMLVNINANLGINVLDTNTKTITYFDLSPFGTDYTTWKRYGTDPVPVVELLAGPMEGFPADETWFKVEMRNVYGPGNAPFAEALSCKWDDVLSGGPQSGPLGSADFFTQAADDARAVIEFLHNWSIPEYE
ncbi:hypothetical protein MUP29_03380 [bacterium]|nr:hypothetical protein [bacterium]